MQKDLFAAFLHGEDAKVAGLRDDPGSAHQLPSLLLKLRKRVVAWSQIFTDQKCMYMGREDVCQKGLASGVESLSSATTGKQFL